MERSYPEAWVSFGRGCVGLSVAAAQNICTLLPLETMHGRNALSIENKETFYNLSAAGSLYEQFPLLVYSAGHPNRAVSLLFRTLSKAGWAFSHAGDLDPDGILIVQELCAITREAGGAPVTPYCMDAETFSQYRRWGRSLPDTSLRRLGLIDADTRALPGIAGLIACIEESALGVEQEIIEYHI
jgi:hypothetical protein